MREKEAMQAIGEEVRHDGESFRRKMHGRLQCRADIPAMDGEFKDRDMHQGTHGQHASRMIAGCVPLVLAEASDEVIALVPHGAENLQQIVAQAISERNSALRPHRRSLLPFLLRGGVEAAWRG